MSEHNPPAFPILTHGLPTGMTLRDYFAAKAMAAIISQPHRYGTDVTAITDSAYEYADAMLSARKETR
jgi:hypothetical protein